MRDNANMHVRIRVKESRTRKDVMIKVYAFITKLVALSEEQFLAHWGDPHGVLTQRIPQFRRYVQNQRVHGVAGFANGSWDGIATIWLDNLEKLDDAMAHPHYPQLDADGDLLYQRDRLAWLIAEETVVAQAEGDANAEPAKLMLFIANGNGKLSVAKLRETMEAADVPGVAGRAFAMAIEDQPYAAALEYGFADIAALDKALARALPATFLPEGVDAADITALAMRERRVIWPESEMENA
jgi:uncharacterized protein (TIGR02118 family)